MPIDRTRRRAHTVDMETTATTTRPRPEDLSTITTVTPRSDGRWDLCEITEDSLHTVWGFAVLGTYDTIYTAKSAQRRYWS